MSFQSIINYASDISIERKPVVAQSVTRDGTVRSVSRGGNTWRFEVTVPSGIRWSTIKSDISKAEELGRLNQDNIQFNDPGHSWLFEYSGDQPDPTTIQVQFSNTVERSLDILGGVTISSGYLFRAGDIVQLTDGVNIGYVYTVRDDVPWNEIRIPLHRPKLSNEPTYTGTPTMRIGPNCRFTVKCIQFPTWRLFERDQVAWDGTFLFQEVIS